MTSQAPATPWRNRIVGSGEEAPDQLVANPANWRTHPPEQQRALAGALGEVGWVAQVIPVSVQISVSPPLTATGSDVVAAPQQ